MTLGNNNDTTHAATANGNIDKTTTTAANGNTSTTPALAAATNGVRKTPAEPTTENATSNETKPAVSNKQVDANTAFLRAARAGDLDRLIQFLETGEVPDIDACNTNGLTALHLAAKDGHLEIVRELLSRGATVDNTTKKGNSALHIASLAGQREVIKLLVQHGADVNRQSQNGFTPLYMAAQENHDASVRYLLSKGSNQTLATEDGFTPLAVAMQQGHDRVVAVLLESDSRGKVRLPALHIAAKKDDTKAASLLLDNDHNPDVSSKSGFTPLHIAAHYGNLAVANLLLTKGADVNYTAKHNITPMHVACKWGKTAMVELLVARGASIDATTRDGLTPLHCAARSGHEQVIDMLAENHANILAKTKNGLAPLHMAAQGEHVDAGRILLYHKAPVDEVTVDYLTALHVAAHCGHVKVAKLLLDRNADPNARALNGFTPLHIACKKNRIKVVELLLKHGASKAATTESGLTPLHVASFMGCMNIVIYLLQHDASADVPTVRGETPLHLAARANQTDIIRILLRNGANVDAKAREEQTPLHVASRLGNVDIVMLLLQHGASVDSTTKDQYTPLHIAAKEGQEDVTAVLLEHRAQLTAVTKKGFTPLHLAAKYGHLNVATALLNRDAPINAQGKNGVTPLHVAAHYDHQAVAMLLLDRGASTQVAANNGHTPLHIAAKKNQMDVAASLLAYHAPADAESKSGFTPIHLAAQEGHRDMTALLLDHEAHPDRAARNGLTPLHLCAQEDKVDVATVLLQNQRTNIDAPTKAGFTPLHVAAHFGQINMVRYLLENDATVETATNIGYTPLHQAAQQGHTLIINLLLKHKADPNALTQNGQSALNIAHRLGYVSVVEVLKVVTETSIVQTEPAAAAAGAPGAEPKYKVVSPESMHETFMSDSEDEGGEDPMMSDYQQYRYMTEDEKGLDDEHHRLDTSAGATGEDKTDSAPHIVEAFIKPDRHEPQFTAGSAPYENLPDGDYPIDRKNGCTLFPLTQPDNVDIVRQPINAGFLVSFLVDARGGAMRGCRHSGVRVIVPPRSAAQPTRITCRYVKPQRMPNAPPLMEGEALVSRILELAPVSAKFLGPVIIEVPHFGSLRDKEREIIILRSDNGETWREHTLVDSEEAIQDVLNDSFEAHDLCQLDDLPTSRIIRIVTHDFPHYFAVVSRIRQEVHAIGPDGGTVSSAAVPQVQAVFPANALTKKIRVGLQAQPIDAQTAAHQLGRGVAVSPVVTVEPRRRKFHRAITLSMPAPRAHMQGMINQYSGMAPTLRLLCSITGGQNRAVWEDVTGSTPLTFVNDCVSFTTTVSARFWLMDCRVIADACRMATELYTFMAYVPFMVRFVVFAKRCDENEARLSVFCMTDDKEDKTLEQQEHFTEVAKSRDIEILEGRPIYLEFGGAIVPVLKTGEQLSMTFGAFKENRLTFTVKVRPGAVDDGNGLGRISFMNEPKVARDEAPLQPMCSLNIGLPEKVWTAGEMASSSSNELVGSDAQLRLHNGAAPLRVVAQSKHSTAPASLALALATVNAPVQQDDIHKADIRLSDICNLVADDWPHLAGALDVQPDDVATIRREFADRGEAHKAMVMLRLWLRSNGREATGNHLEQALHAIGRSDVVDQCIFNLELVTDEMERETAKRQLQHDQSGFGDLRAELGDDEDAEQATGITAPSDDRKVTFKTTSDSLVSPRAEHDADEDDEQPNGSPDDSGATTSEASEEALRQVRDHIRLGGHLNGRGIGGTPPPSPADFAQAGHPLEHSNPGGSVLVRADVEPVRAEEERMDLTLQLEEDERQLLQQQALRNGDEAQHTDSLEDEDSAEAAINRQLAAAAHLEQIEADIADIVEEAQQHVDQVKAAAAAAAAAAAEEVTTATRPAPKESTPEPRTESRIPVAAARSSNSATPPSKVKTIKKHSKVTAKPHRPTVEDIEWAPVVATQPPLSITGSSSVDEADPAPENVAQRITELSTLQLEDVSSPNEHQCFEPMVILSPGDDYSGEIDEVILVQTPGDDGDVEDGDGDTDAGFSPQRRRIEDVAGHRHEVHEFDEEDEYADDTADGGMNVVRKTKTTTRTTTSTTSGPVVTTTTRTTVVRTAPPHLTFSTDDDVPAISLSLHSSDMSEADDDDEGVRIVQADDEEAAQAASSSAASIVSEVAPANGPLHPQPSPGSSQRPTVTFGSSSGSDVALHEAGAEPSDDDVPESDFYQSTELAQPVAAQQQHSADDGRTTTVTTTTYVSSGDGQPELAGVDNQFHSTTTTTTKTTVVKDNDGDAADQTSGTKTIVTTSSTTVKQ